MNKTKYIEFNKEELSNLVCHVGELIDRKNLFNITHEESRLLDISYKKFLFGAMDIEREEMIEQQNEIFRKKYGDIVKKCAAEKV